MAEVTAALTAAVPLHQLGLPDPSVPAGRLAAIDGEALQEAARWLSGIAAAIAAAAAAGTAALGQVERGWSAPGPALHISRLLRCAEQTAELLHAHSVALDDAAAVVRDQQINAHNDALLASAEISARRSTSWTDAAGALLGDP